MTIRTWVDIEDAAGQKVGDGPLVSVTDWQQTARLDRAGEFAFRMPASDPRAAEVRPKRYARCWHAGPEGLKSLGHGRIERVALTETDTGPMLEVSGVDLLGELADRIMRREALRTEVTEHPASHLGWTIDDYLNVIDGAVGDTTTAALQAAPGDGGRTGHWCKFHKMNFVLGAAKNNNVLAVGFEHSNSDDSWTPLTIVSDTTQAAPGVSFSQSGSVEWTVPSGWEGPSDSILYFVKQRVTGGGFDDVDVTDMSITYYAATITALDDIMAYAPDGWSLDAATGYTELQKRPLTGTEVISTHASFETIGVGDTVDDATTDTFTGWTNSIGGTSKVLAVTGGHTGNCVKLLTGGTGGAVDFSSIYRDITVTESTEYTLSFWVQGDGTYGGQYRIHDQSHNVDVNGYGAPLRNITDMLVTAAEWTQLSYLFVTPPGCTSIRIRFYSPVQANGYCLVDDVSLQAGGGNSIYLQCSDESVLEMLIRVAEATGEHFILSPDGRKVLWLGNDERTLALRAVSNVNPVEVAGVDNIAIITNISEIEDTSDVVSRVYPYGAGMGGSRVTLADATTEPPSGYVVSKADNYVQRTAAVTALGVVETVRSWADIVEQSDDTTAAAQSAANTLLIQAVNWLSTHSCTSTARLTGDAPRFYELGLTKCEQMVFPGHKLRVVHHNWVDGYHAVSIDRDLWITGATWRVGANGAETVALQVATVDRQAVNDAMATATSIRRLTAIAAHNTAAGY